MRLLALACIAVTLLSTVPAARATGLTLGFLDSLYTASPDLRDPWLQRTVDAQADMVRIDVGWVAPNTERPPAGFQPRNPADPAYDFSKADAAIRAAAAHGLHVLAGFVGAPRWAEGGRRPADAPAGTWRPSPQAIEDYGAALALRYSGRFPDPATPGTMLPRVNAFQLWNEPNLDKYLTPQWSGTRTVAPAHYRRMLNAFYRGVKSVSPDALVVTAGTAPFGDAAPGGRIMPVRFWREALCVRRSGARLRAADCPDPAHFDVLAHHPYSVGSPANRALNADDVSIPDLHKLTRVLRAAERSGRALPAIAHRLWVTEVSYDSGPPDPGGIPLATHARFLEQTFYELWHQGVDTVVWFHVADEAPDPSYAATNQSGVYLRDGHAKPALQAFRFPLVAQRSGPAHIQVWGRAPAAGEVSIEEQTRSGWRTVARLTAAAHSVFVRRVAGRAAIGIRARLSNYVSLTWPLS